jgi:hypothetical protein
MTLVGCGLVIREWQLIFLQGAGAVEALPFVVHAMRCCRGAAPRLGEIVSGGRSFRGPISFCIGKSG